MGDDHHLLAKYRRHELERRQAEALVRGVDRAISEGRVRRAPVDAMRARGVPILGPGSAGGHIPGSRPDHEILRLDERQKRKRRRRL
jgi:hypothetical protein